MATSFESQKNIFCNYCATACQYCYPKMTPTAVQQLRNARQALGLSLADVAHATRIPVEKLQLLEEGKLAAIGSMTYARSFLRMYANHVGVDVESLAEALPQPILGGTADYRYLTESHGRWVTDESRLRSEAMQAPRRTAASPLLKVAAMLLFVGALAAWWGSRYREAELGYESPQDLAGRRAGFDPVAMSAAQAGKNLASQASASSIVRWDQVNKQIVRRAQELEDPRSSAPPAGRKSDAPVTVPDSVQ